MKHNHKLVIGRIVHYTAGFSMAMECLPAMTVKVRNARAIDLQVFKAGGQHGTVGEVGVLHGMEVGQWHWPDECPYEREAAPDLRTKVKSDPDDNYIFDDALPG